MKWRSYGASFLLAVMFSFPYLSAAQVPPSPDHSTAIGQPGSPHDHHGGPSGDGWEGSPEGIAFSVFNHHFAGFCDVLFGLAELGNALQYPLPLWTRLALPATLGVVGVFVLIWGDHDAWPIGSLSFGDTFFGQDREILEHKLYGVLAIVIAVCEWLRRIGLVRHPVWAVPLVLLTLVAGLLLFVHSHGNHPAAARIQFHHALLGSVGVCAALSKSLAAWSPGTVRRTVNRWEVAWAGSVILFGLLLLVYSE